MDKFKQDEIRTKKVWEILKKLNKVDRKTLIKFMGDYRKDDLDLMLGLQILKDANAKTRK